MNRLLIASSVLVCSALAISAVDPSSATTPNLPSSAALATGALNLGVDGSHSSVLFKVKHNGASYFYGRFNEVEGTVTYDADDVSKSSVEIKIKADSVDSNSKKRDQHLLSPDFLDAKQFPEMKFTSSSVAMKGDVLQATGILDFHGTRKEITIDIDKVGEGKTRKGGVLVGFHSQFTIDRTDFGVTYGEGALGADIELTVSLETISK